MRASTAVQALERELESTGRDFDLDTDAARQFIDELGQRRDTIVPVVGSGLVASAGGVGTEQLVDELSLAAGVIGPGPPAASSLYSLADELEVSSGTGWVQDEVARIVTACPVSPTPTLLALVRAPSRIVLTTNWDDGVERAASEAGLTAQSFVGEALARGLDRPSEGSVNVLHLHGAVSDPETIVLTADSYQRALEDPQVEAVVRALALVSRLLFIGHGLDPREADLDRNLLWAFQTKAGAAPHLLLAATGSAPHQMATQIEERTGVAVVSFSERDGRHSYAARVARLLAGPSPLAYTDLAERLDPRRVEEAYVPLAAVTPDEAGDSPEYWRMRLAMLDEEPTTPHHLQDRRMLLLGRPLVGKTQTLLHLARASDRGLYLRLGNLRPSQHYEEPEDTFVAWMSEARAVKTRVPRLTRALLGDEALDLFLDGIDEAPSDIRVNLVQVIDALASRYPQHRWVVATRPIPVLLDPEALPEFSRYQLEVPSDWLGRYVRLRGHSPDEFRRLFEALPAAESLAATSPFYAAAAVEAVEEVDGGAPLPATALDLGLLLADRGLGFEQDRLYADPEEVRRWLNRVALAMELLGVNQVGQDELLDSDLAAGLDLHPDPALMERLMERTLLAVSGGRVGFASNSLQEIRAAAALRDRPDALELLRTFSLGSVGGRLHVWSSFSHALDLFLSAASDDQRSVIAEYDPLAVARTTSLDAPGAARLAAVQAIWSWYEEKRIWIPRKWEPAAQIVNDLGAIGRLWGPGGFDGEPFRDTVRAATSSPERTARGNAPYVLAELEDREGALRAAPVLIEDDDPVVVRRAAEVAVRFEVADLLERIVERAKESDDELCRRTLCRSAIALAPQDRLTELVRVLPRSERPYIHDALDARLPLGAQLEVLETLEELDHTWLEHLLDRRNDWTEAEVRAVARLLDRDVEHVLHLSGQVEKVLIQCPAPALEERLRASKLDAADVWELGGVIRAIDHDTLEKLLSEGSLPSEVADHVRDVHAAGTRHAASKPQPPPASSSRSEGLMDRVERGPAALLSTRPRDEEIEALAVEERQRIVSVVRREKGRLVRHFGRSPFLEVHRTDERSWSAPRVAWRLLEWWEALALRLDFEEWRTLARLGFGTDSTRQWMRRSFRDAWWKRPPFDELADVTTGADLEGIVSNLPEGWPPSRAHQLAERCYVLGVAEEHRRRCVRELLRARRWAALRRLWTDHGNDDAAVALVQGRACDAETWLLQRWIDQGCPIDRLRMRYEGELEWFPHLRCRSSVSLLREGLTRLLRAGTQVHEFRPVLQALERVVGPRVMEIYNEWRNDPEIPSSSFLIYEEDRALDAFLEAKVRAVAPGGLHDVAAALMDGQVEAR